MIIGSRDGPSCSYGIRLHNGSCVVREMITVMANPGPSGEKIRRKNAP